MKQISRGSLKGNAHWSKLALMLAMVFFLYFGDAIFSDWVPAYMQKATGSPFLMGLMMSFSSMVGFAVDLILPQLIRNISTRKLIVLAISSMFLTAGAILWTTAVPLLPLFLLAMGFWGVYYEFLGFGMAQFVSHTATMEYRPGYWSVIMVFKSVAYFVGPLVGSWIFVKWGDMVIIFVYITMAIVAYLIWLTVGASKHELHNNTAVKEQFDMVLELKRWRVLLGHLWPILLASLFLGIVDAVFWTTGVVMSDRLVQDNWVGAFFVPAYVFPSMFVGLLILKLGIYKGKKKLVESFLLLSGLFMAAIGLVESVPLMVMFALLVGSAMAVAWPYVDAVYSDILARMGHEQRHLLGLSGSMISLSYVIGPVIAGFITLKFGESFTMVTVGMVVAAVAMVLLFVTPKKLRLPQAEIRKWD